MRLSNLSLVIIFLLFTNCKSSFNKWEQINIGLNDNFHDIAPIDKNNLIVYSYGSGLIAKSTDQGKNWKTVHKTDSIYYEQVEFLNPLTGFICGNTNKILKTIDGGNHWKEIEINSISKSALIYGMKFRNPQTGYISVLERTNNGFHSKIYQTINSGLDWIEINSIPEMILNLELINEELWASGNNIVLKNIDKKDYETVYKDNNNKVGQIRDFIVDMEKIVMVSFNGFIIYKGSDGYVKNQITKNRIRSVVDIGNGELIAAGDNNKEKGNLYLSLDDGKTWEIINKDLNDIHRLKINDRIVWGIGKKDQLIRLKL